MLVRLKYRPLCCSDKNVHGESASTLNCFRSQYMYVRSVRVRAGGAGSVGITPTGGEKLFKRMGWRGGLAAGCCVAEGHFK